MPINYHVKIPMHCSNLDPALQDSIQGCRYEREKIPEFKPMNRAAVIAVPDLDAPGINAKHCTSPIIKAPYIVISYIVLFPFV